MSPPPASIDQILSSAIVGGAVVSLSLALLFLSQLLYWGRTPAPPSVRLWVPRLAGATCVLALILIAARFVIIA